MRWPFSYIFKSFFFQVLFCVIFIFIIFFSSFLLNEELRGRQTLLATKKHCILDLLGLLQCRWVILQIEGVLPRNFFSMAVILKGKLVLQYEKNSKINILSDNFRVLAWKFSTSFRKMNSLWWLYNFFLRLLSHLMKWDDKGSFFIAQYDFWAMTESLQCQYTSTWRQSKKKLV